MSVAAGRLVALLAIAACAACSSPSEPAALDPSVDAAAARGPLTTDSLIYVEEQRVTATGDSIFFENFGTSVAVSGDTALVGSPYEALPGGAFQGAAYFFVRTGTTWTQQARFTSSNWSYGSAVALADDHAFVGAPYDNVHDDFHVSEGSVSFFARDGATWSQVPEAVRTFESYGAALAMSADTALVAMPYGVDGDHGLEEVDVLALGGGGVSLQATLTPGDGAPFDTFGVAVAVSGDTALVGADSADVAGNSDGAVYVFVRSGTSWTEQAKLTPGAGWPVDSFGHAVALSGDTALVGAPNEDTVRVFVRSGTTWSQQATLTDGGAALAFFGDSVALSGDTAVIGATAEGTVRTFVRSGTTWSEQPTFTDGDGTAHDFGHAVALSGSPLSGFPTAVGSPGRDGPGAPAEGAVYLGRLTSTTPCAGVAAGMTCRASAGPCDVAETCDGVDDACPPDGFVAAGTRCGSADDTVCDHPDTCDGAGICQPNPEPATTICRPSAGDCDVAETCDGAGACPADRVPPDGDVFGVPAPCGAPGGCCGAGGGRASSWLGLIVLGFVHRRRGRGLAS